MRNMNFKTDLNSKNYQLVQNKLMACINFVETNYNLFEAKRTIWFYNKKKENLVKRYK